MPGWHCHMDAAGIITITWPKKSSWFSFTNLFSPELCPPNSFTLFHVRTLSYLWVFLFFPKFFFFFKCEPFLKTSLLNLLQYHFCFMFWTFDLRACEILAPWPGLESAAPCIGRWSPYHWTTRKVWFFFFLPPSRSNWPQSSLDFLLKYI